MITDVWYANRKVGTYDVPTKSGEIPSEFPIIKYGLNKDLADTPDFHWIQIDRRHCEIDERQMKSGEMSHITRAYDIPENAEHRMFVDMESNSRRVRFSWFVATPSLDQYEIMFDHTEFEPI